MVLLEALVLLDAFWVLQGVMLSLSPASNLALSEGSVSAGETCWLMQSFLVPPPQSGVDGEGGCLVFQLWGW